VQAIGADFCATPQPTVFKEQVLLQADTSTERQKIPVKVSLKLQDSRSTPCFSNNMKEVYTKESANIFQSKQGTQKAPRGARKALHLPEN